MPYTRRHWREKIQIQLATALVLAGAYFGLWRLFTPYDPAEPIVFLSIGSVWKMATFAVILWVISAIVSFGVRGTRPAGPLIAVFIGAGGVSLRSPQIRTLLWEKYPSIGGIYGFLIGEIVIMTLIMAGAVIIAGLIRGAIGESKSMDLPSPDEDDGEDDFQKEGSTAAQCLYNFGFGVLLSIVLLLLIVQSAQRGQILFGLLASFFVGFLVAHQLIPANHVMLAPAGAAAVAVVVYILGATSVTGDSPQSWMSVPLYARALPIDWMTFGAGGGVLGYWVSERIHEARHYTKYIVETGGA